MPNLPKTIFWLASYPKSGNTWFRIVLSHLLQKEEKPLSLDEIQTGSIASARGWSDTALGVDSADFSHDELEPLRRLAYLWHGAHLKEPGYHKIHDAYHHTSEGLSMIPPEISLGALYFIRNPLDVAISFANHQKQTIDKVISQMNDASFAFCDNNKKQPNQLRQKLFSWSSHVESWLQANEMNTCVLRYEDMKERPLETFGKASCFLNLRVSRDNLVKAIEASSIERLQALEKENGFSEKPSGVKTFFRKGICGDWKTVLTRKQIDKIIHDHGAVMEQFGYLI